MSTIKDGQGKDSYLSFTLGTEKFATHVDKVLNILEMRTITKVPQAPEYMKGVINLRGNVLPVIDLRIKLNIEAKAYSVDTCIIVFNLTTKSDNLIVGALVDDVNEVLELGEGDIEPAPSIGTMYDSDFIIGMSHWNNSFIMLLNIESVLANDCVLIKSKDEIEL